MLQNKRNQHNLKQEVLAKAIKGEWIRGYARAIGHITSVVKF